MHDERHIISLKKPQLPQEPLRVTEPIAAEKKSRTPVYIVLGLLVTALVLGGAVKFRVLQRLHLIGSVESTTPSVDSKKEAADLVAEVGKLIILPEGEVPSIATINDPAKYAEQPFFQKAKTGDIVLVYIEAKKAYLYRPSVHQLIEVSPITPEAQ